MTFAVGLVLLGLAIVSWWTLNHLEAVDEAREADASGVPSPRATDAARRATPAA